MWGGVSGIVRGEWDCERWRVKMAFSRFTVTVFLYSHLFGRLVPQNYVQPLPPSSLGGVSDTPSHQYGMASGRTEGSQSS